MLKTLNPAVRTKPGAKIAKEDVFEFFLAFDHEHPRQFTKILRASLPLWAESFEKDSPQLELHAPMLVDWCRKCGLRIPGWLSKWKDSNPWDRGQAAVEDHGQELPPPEPGEPTN